jgi:predicted P-loop ATPase
MSETIDNIIDLAAVKADAWVSRLDRKDGNVLPTQANVLRVLAHDPALRGMLAFNAFTAEPLIMRAPPVSDDDQPEMPGPYPRPWSGADVTLIHAYLQRIWSNRISAITTEAGMLTEATLRHFHPIADWLRDLRWDGTERIDNWLVNAFDCEPTPFHRAAGAKMLIAAVRRVLHPGCKFDQMLVLEGAQGIGKSRALRVLFGDAWFSDAIPSDLTSKDAAMALLGVWGLEFAEIEHLIRAEVETIKAFLSRSVDRYRPPYGKSYVERPRQGVLIGTTNSDDYLRDASGNRRIWPVRCKAADPEWIHVNRDQLWAEAVVREAKGEPIWLDDTDIRDEAAQAQSERMATDPWAQSVAGYIKGRDAVVVSDILGPDGLGIPKERWTRAAEMRVASILRQIGWTKKRERMNGTPMMVWRGVHTSDLFANGLATSPSPDETIPF